MAENAYGAEDAAAALVRWARAAQRFEHELLRATQRLGNPPAVSGVATEIVNTNRLAVVLLTARRPAALRGSPMSPMSPGAHPERMVRLSVDTVRSAFRRAVAGDRKIEVDGRTCTVAEFADLMRLRLDDATLTLRGLLGDA